MFNQMRTDSARVDRAWLADVLSLEMGLSVLGVLNKIESQLELTALGWPTCPLEMGLSGWAFWHSVDRAWQADVYP